MKCFIAILLLALFAVAFAAETPTEPKEVEPVNVDPENAPRDKRGLLLSYTSPLTYTSYPAPLSYGLPYAYRTYPYSSYYGSYYLG